MLTAFICLRLCLFPQHIVLGLLNSHPWVCRRRCWIWPFPTLPRRRDPYYCCCYNLLTPPHIWKIEKSWFQSNQSWFQSNQSWFQSQNTMFQDFKQNVFIHFIIFHIIKVSFWAVQPTSYEQMSDFKKREKNTIFWSHA